ncbi:MAG: hypothetical protein KQI81_20530 [Deltaproteobacteria bacterium]|nr:hypothetical protein [Deltaproteobacteria bacterium]
MTWISVPGLAGKVYVPDEAGQVEKKHSCKTCFSCQWCDENRCQVCRGDLAETSACPPMRCRGRIPGRPTPADHSYPVDRK